MRKTCALWVLIAIDPRVTRLFQMALGSGHQLEEAAGDHGEAVVEARPVERADLSAIREARIGHEHIEAAESRGSPLDQQPSGLGDGEVAEHHRRAGAGPLQLGRHGLAAGAVVQGVNQDSYARARQAAGDGGADAAPRAGHQDRTKARRRCSGGSSFGHHW